MDKTTFEQAQKAYDAGDYSRALAEFLDVAKSSIDSFEPGDKGYIYHMMGNCLVKMKRFDKAIPTYQRALNDIDYGHAAALHVNLGVAYSATKHYEAAIDSFQKALDDDTYETPYKAYAAMGNALLKLNRPADAGVVFRKAALEENNPDPGRSLVNLGVCFMALNRPHDAVESYVAALDFDTTSEARSKTYANLGQAYVATGRMTEAVDAFEHALEDGTYKLSDSAATDYDRAKAIARMEANPDAGLDTFGSGYLDQQVLHNETAVIPSPDDTGFFTITEEQIENTGKYAKTKGGKQKKSAGVKVFTFFLVLALILAIGAATAYLFGFGWPLQESVIEQTFAANAQGQPVNEYWNASANEIETAMSGVADNDDITIESVDRGLTESTAVVTQKLDKGGSVRYRITMSRSLPQLGWKISDIDFDFASYPY
jgi:tetratricopeptide (TPR) repeat protein